MSEKLIVTMPAGLLDQLLGEFFDEDQDDFDEVKLNQFVVECIHNGLADRAAPEPVDMDKAQRLEDQRQYFADLKRHIDTRQD